MKMRFGKWKIQEECSIFMHAMTTQVAQGMTLCLRSSLRLHTECLQQHAHRSAVDADILYFGGDLVLDVTQPQTGMNQNHYKRNERTFSPTSHATLSNLFRQKKAM